MVEAYNCKGGNLYLQIMRDNILLLSHVLLDQIHLSLTATWSGSYTCVSNACMPTNWMI